MYIGESNVGEGSNYVSLSVFIGFRDAYMGVSTVNSVSSQKENFPSFMASYKEGFPVKPATLISSRTKILNEKHRSLILGAVQIGISSGIRISLQSGTIPEESIDEWCIIISADFNPNADNEDEVYENSKKAIIESVDKALMFLPSEDDLDGVEIGNRYYTPKLG